MQDFNLELKWQGSTLGEFSRTASASVAGKPTLALSAAPTYSGDPTCWNPEDLFGASLAMCHMLTFLTLAHKYKLDVLSYDDHTQVVLDVVDRVTRITRVVLAPDIRVAAGTDIAKVNDVFQKAHKYCFIGNSITSEVVMTPNVTAEQTA